MPTALSDIQERMLDKMSNATRLVEKLRQKSYVTRTECMENRRKVDIHITDAGLALLAAVNEKMNRFETEMLEKISDDDIHALNRILDKLR